MNLQRIGDLFNVEKGSLQSTKSTEGKYTFITAAEDWKTHNAYTHNCEALIFAAAASGSLGRTHYFNGKFISSDLCFILTPKDTKKYPIDLKFYHFVFNNIKDEIVKKTKTGTSKESINITNFSNYLIPYFNVTLQHLWIDKLTVVRENRNNLTGEFNFQLSNIQFLRQAILQEAVQGKLVPHDPKDEPASELLKRIKEEKAKQTKKGKTETYEPITDVPYEIPKGWVWCRLNEIAEQITDGEHITPPKVENGFKLLSAKNVRNGFIDYDNCEYISKDIYEKCAKRCRPSKGDLLIVSVGGTIGRSSLVVEDIEFIIVRSVALIRPMIVYSNYLKILMDSPLLQSIIEEKKRGGAQPCLYLSEINKFTAPIPPLNEQKRIIAKVQQLMELCDEMEAQVQQSKADAEKLLQAVLREAFELREDDTQAVKQPKLVETELSKINIAALDANPFGDYISNPVNPIQNINWELAMMVACIENSLHIGYGDVGLQKNVFNTSVRQQVFSKQYDFINSNFGTYSYTLKDDLNNNPYLIRRSVKGKEVYTINPKYKTQVLDKLSAPENKDFVQALSHMLNIYEHPFINKETDKIELFNTVLKMSLDKKSIDIEVVYQGMKDWKIKQEKFNTKAEKFSKSDTYKMLKLLIEKKMLNA